jgi:hypothetical protein
MTNSNSNNELASYFISHSGKDIEIVEEVLTVFKHHGRRPYKIITEDELSRTPDPHWLYIKSWIQKSDAVFLILSGGITEQEHTQNWVAFEVGVAAGCNPPKPVIAIKGEDVVIPIPYLTHYYSYSPTVPASQWRASGTDLWHGQSKMGMHPMLSDPNYKVPFLPTTCSHCKLRYYYHGSEICYKCPCCSKITLHGKYKEQQNDN